MKIPATFDIAEQDIHVQNGCLLDSRLQILTYTIPSVGYELTQMSLNSRVNSLAVIYEFELTHLKECEL